MWNKYDSTCNFVITETNSVLVQSNSHVPTVYIGKPNKQIQKTSFYGFL